jgi:hypothetical protein
MLRTALFAAAIALTGVAGCDFDPFVPDFEYEAVQWSLLPAEDGTRLHFVEVYSGLQAQGDLRAAKALGEMVRRRRVDPPEGGLLSSDLDGPRQATPDGESPDARTALEHRMRDLSRVLGAGLYVDQAGELCAWRVTELLSLEQLLAGIDAVISAEVLRAFADDEIESSSSFPWYDEDSRTLARERALAGGPWVRWVKGRITLDVPLSEAAAARALEACSSRHAVQPIAPWFLSQVACFTCDGGRALLSLGTVDDPAVKFEIPAGEDVAGPDRGLIQAVEAAGISIGDAAGCERSVDELTGRK